jgi:hypothetical protein
MSDQADTSPMKTWALGAVLLVSTGCGSLVMKLHPFHVTPQQTDVLWLQRGGEVYRCSNTATGPLCLLSPFAKVPEAASVAQPEPPVSVTPLEPQPEGK